MEKAGGTVKILAAPKDVDEVPRGKNKRMALDAAKGGGKPKGGAPKAPKAEAAEKPAEIAGQARAPDRSYMSVRAGAA